MQETGRGLHGEWNIAGAARRRGTAGIAEDISRTVTAVDIALGEILLHRLVTGDRLQGHTRQSPTQVDVGADRTEGRTVRTIGINLVGTEPRDELVATEFDDVAPEERRRAIQATAVNVE